MVTQFKTVTMKIKAAMRKTLQRLGSGLRTDSRAQSAGTLVEMDSGSKATSKRRAKFAFLDDRRRNELQKMVLLVEHSHLLGETSKKLVEQSQALHVRTRKLIADAKRDVKKKGKSA